MSYHRHTLCYLKPGVKPLASTDDELLSGWLKHQFPLIYTHQPSHLGPNQLKLAIPYFEPTTQQKIRKSYLFSPDSISHSKALPELKEICPNLVLKSNSNLRVYGSYCWQYITQHPYVQPSSDLDLHIEYTGESLAELAQLYSKLKNVLPIKSIDGEVRFSYFGDCSWLELIEASSENILFKSEHHIRLLAREELYAHVPTLLR
jgi:phosphoribosyl-dephospho-CoA transferase